MHCGLLSVEQQDRGFRLWDTFTGAVAANHSPGSMGVRCLAQGPPGRGLTPLRLACKDSAVCFMAGKHHAQRIPESFQPHTDAENHPTACLRTLSTPR